MTDTSGTAMTLIDIQEGLTRLAAKLRSSANEISQKRDYAVAEKLDNFAAAMNAERRSILLRVLSSSVSSNRVRAKRRSK